MDIKLAVFDLDGTLLNPDDGFTPKTGAALKALYDSGVKLMICSGRAPSMGRAYFREAGVTGYLCCAGGAYIEDEAGQVIHTDPLTVPVLNRILPELRGTDVHFSLMTREHVHTDASGAGIPLRFQRYAALARKHGLPYGELRQDRDALDFCRETIYKIPVLEFDPARFGERLEMLAQFSDMVEIVPSGTRVIDITAKGNSKGRAVEIVAARLGLRREEIFCIGDYDNDVAMFRQAGLSVAMGNAPDSVKAAADYVTGTNQEDGAAEAIRHCLLSGKEFL